MANPWRYVDLRHQKNGQIAIWRGPEHVANVLARSPDAEKVAILIVRALNADASLSPTPQ